MRKDYYNGSAEDIVKRFFRNINIVRAIVLIILLVSYAYYVFSLFTVGENPTGTLIILLLLCAAAIFIRRIHALIELSMLNFILNRDCDPVKFADVFLILRSKRWFRRRRDSAALNIAQGYYYSGRFEDAYKMLTEVKPVASRPMLALQYFNLFANCGTELERPDFVSYAKTGVERILETAKPKSANAKGAQTVLNVIHTTEAVQTGNFDEAIALLNHYQMEAQSPFQKLSAEYQLAKIYFKTGDYQNAKSRLEFVLQNGNKLYYVERAKEMLPQCNG